MHHSLSVPIKTVHRPTTNVYEEFSCSRIAKLSGASDNGNVVEFGRYLDQTYDVVQPRKLFDVVVAFAQQFDYSWAAYVPLAYTTSEPLRGAPATMLNYPNEWQKRYRDRGYGKVDPLINKTKHRLGALRWTDVYADANTTESERRIFDEAATFGLRSGITVPLHGPNGSFATVSFAKCTDHEIPGKIITLLELAARHFHLRIDAFGRKGFIGPARSLSAREKECIQWVAKGKSSTDIGVILGISGNTVDFHLKNSMRKLGCGSRTVAVVNALKSGIIDA
ncbi:MAG: LuxR family transcriptional regulator [Mesorhizobium sp.]|nr:MAG: LuxR family transcriptional regulator [Mesorhizobium sp.]